MARYPKLPPEEKRRRRREHDKNWPYKINIPGADYRQIRRLAALNKSTQHGWIIGILRAVMKGRLDLVMEYAKVKVCSSCANAINVGGRAQENCPKCPKI